MTHILQPALTAIPPDLVCLTDYEKAARDFIRHDILEYINGGVADDSTRVNNTRAFDDLTLYNRILADFSQPSTRTQLFNTPLAHPIILAPVAHQQLVHPDGECATAAAAAAMNTPMIVSSLSNQPLQDIAAQGAHWWFQLYWQPSLEANQALLKRAIDAGCEAIVVTLDAPVSGLRNRAQRAGFQLPDHVQEINLSGLPAAPVRTLNPGDSRVLHGFMQDAPSRDNLAQLRQWTDLPLLAKGLSHPEDARALQALGFDGLIVSTHGGRTLDGLPAAIHNLPRIRAACPDLPILMDSGIRRGTDVLKALALGADAVCIGRPQMWGLAVAGALGVAHCLKILQEELEVAMALTGCATLEHITDAVLAPVTIR